MKLASKIGISSGPVTRFYAARTIGSQQETVDKSQLPTEPAKHESLILEHV